ncbi:MAG: hypothetical protein QM817_06980 [Archangium sp.]
MLTAAMRCLAATFFLLTGCLQTIDVEPPKVCEVLPFRELPKIIPRDTTSPLDVPFITDACLAEGVTATIELFDEQNLPVLFSSTLEVGGRSAIAHLEVLPRHVGELHVIVTFEPSLGRVVRSTLVVDPPPLAEFKPAIDGPCEDEALTASGTWVCRLANEVTVWRQGMLLQSLPATAMTTADDSVWLVTPDQLERFVDRGLDFLVRAPDAAMPFVAPDTALLGAGPDTLWTVDASRATRWRLDATGLVNDAELSLPRGLCATAASFTANTDALIMSCSSRAAHTRLCRFAASGIGDARCVELEGTLLGLDDEHVWLSIDGAVLHAGLDESTRIVLPPGFSVEAPSRFFETTSWPIASDGKGATVLITREGLQLPPAGLDVRGHGLRGVLVQRGGVRSLIGR